VKSKELLFSITKKDFDISFYSGTGAGGQHRNRHMNCVRIKHPESGAMASGTESRNKQSNIKTAFKRLVESDAFKKWFRIRTSREISSVDTIQKQVDDMMKPENLKIEHKENEKWVLS